MDPHLKCVNALAILDILATYNKNNFDTLGLPERQLTEQYFLSDTDATMDMLELGASAKGLTRAERLRLVFAAKARNHLIRPEMDIPDISWTEVEVAGWLGWLFDLDAPNQPLVSWADIIKRRNVSVAGTERGVDELVCRFDKELVAVENDLRKVDPAEPALSIPAFTKLSELLPLSLDNAERLGVIRRAFGVSPQAPQTPDQLKDKELEIIQRAFDIDYIGTEHVSSFTRHLHWLVWGVNKRPVSHKANCRPPRAHVEDYYACYTFVGQSSGGGKSKLVYADFDPEDNAVLNVVVNCRSKGRAGFPVVGSGDELVMRKLLREGCVFRQMRNLIVSLLLAIRNKIMVIHHHKDCAGGSDACLLKDDERCYYVLKEGLTPKGISINQLGLTEGDFGGLTDVVEKELAFLGHIRTSTGRRVLLSITFDEASRLIEHSFEDEKDRVTNLFKMLRRVIGNEQTRWLYWLCPFVFLDTNTKLANFLPSLLYDKSARNELYEDRQGGKKFGLFGAFILTWTWNLFQDTAYSPRSPKFNWFEFMRSSRYLLDVLKIGRPLWGAILCSYEVLAPPLIPPPSLLPTIDKAISDIMFMASRKLIRYPELVTGRRFRDLEEPVKLNMVAQALACVAFTAGLNRIAATIYSSALVEQHMAFLMSHDYKNTHTVVSHPQETALAIVALNYLYLNAETVLYHINRSFAHGIASVGDKGEFGGRILLLLAMARELQYDLLPAMSNAESSNEADRVVVGSDESMEEEVESMEEEDECMEGEDDSDLISDEDMVDVPQEQLSENVHEDEIANYEFDYYVHPALGDGSIGMVPVRQFLANIVGANLVASIEQSIEEKKKGEAYGYPEEVLNGYVSFSHFTQPLDAADNPRDNLDYALMCHAAIHTIRDYPGIDDAIPVVLRNGRVGCIPVQIKNYRERLGSVKGSVETQDLFKRMDQPNFTSHDIPTLFLLLNVSNQTNCFSEFGFFETIQGRKVLGIAINGIGGPNFKALWERPAGPFLRLPIILTEIVESSRYKNFAKQFKVLKGQYPGANVLDFIGGAVVYQAPEAASGPFQDHRTGPPTVVEPMPPKDAGVRKPTKRPAPLSRPASPS